MILLSVEVPERTFTSTALIKATFFDVEMLVVEEADGEGEGVTGADNEGGEEIVAAGSGVGAT